MSDMQEYVLPGGLKHINKVFSFVWQFKGQKDYGPKDYGVDTSLPWLSEEKWGKVHLNMAEEKDLTSSSDMVNHPPHYTNSNIECIDAIKEALGDGYENYLQGVIIKYMWRYNHKGKPVEDLKKAQWYLEELIEIKQEK